MSSNNINNNNSNDDLNHHISNQPNTIFVGGINWRADENALKTYFNKFGPVVDCKIIMDKTTLKSKGYGFITFQSQETINLIRSSPNLMFMGKNMNIGDAVRKGNQNKIVFHSPNIIYPDRNLEDSDGNEISSLTQSSPLLLSEQSTPILSSHLNINQNGNIYNNSNLFLEQQQVPLQPTQSYYYSNHQHNNGYALHPQLQQLSHSIPQGHQPMSIGSYGYLVYDPPSGSTFQIPFQYYQNTPPPSSNNINPNTVATSAPIQINNNTTTTNPSYQNTHSNSPHYSYHSPTHYVYQTYHYHIDQNKNQPQPQPQPQSLSSNPNTNSKKSNVK